MDVKSLQTEINAAGFGPLNVDGDIGPATIRAFQRWKGLTIDGVAGPQTKAALALWQHGEDVQDSVATGAGFPMTFSAKGIAMLAKSEAVKTHAYYDDAKPPVLTIGIGCTMGSRVFRDWWRANKPTEPFTIMSIITLDQAYEVTRLMISDEYGQVVNHMLGHTIPQPQFDAAVHFLWNVGVGATSWRWAAPFKAGDYCGAAAIIETYLKPASLKQRREHEANLMCHGAYY